MGTTKLLQRIFLLSLFLFGGLITAQAQQLLDGYITENVGVWEPLEDATFIGRGDDPWGEIAMPFDFRYDSQDINRVYVYGNGFISLNYERSPFSQNIPNFAQYRNLISWYAGDLYTRGDISYKIEGNAPFRVLTVQQTDARTFLDFSGARIDVQIKFFETSNEIKIIYGKSSGIGGKDIDGALYLCGSRDDNEYINIKPENPLSQSTLYYSDQNPDETYWLSDETKNYLPEGKTYTYSSNPTIAGIYPGREDILVKGDVYEGDDRPYVRINRGESMEEVSIRYKISGPLPADNPDYKTIYTAVEQVDSSELVKVDPQPVGSAVIFRMPHALDIAGRFSDGALDLNTNQGQIEGGEYEVEVVLETPGTGYSQTYKTTTTVALADNIAITALNSPSNEEGIIYSLSTSIINPEIEVTNFGSQGVTRFKATAKIYKGSDLVQELPAITWPSDNDDTLKLGETVTLQFADFVPPSVGDFRLETEVEILSALEDQYPVDNVFPRDADPAYVFKVGYEIEAEPVELIQPGDTVFVGTPIIPGITIKNNGVSDINDVPVKITITSPGGDTYERELNVAVIPHGLVDEIEFYFDQTFVPEEIGLYEVQVRVNANGDQEQGNDILNTSFEVIEGLEGEYHISANELDVPENRHYNDIQSAISDLYTKGVSGAVTFYLYDEMYEVGNETSMEPAIDLSSRIIGVDSENTVTFMPHESIEGSGNAHVMLNTGTGIGVLFGQNTNPKNQNAPVLNVFEARKSDFANGAEYITFDGGESRSMTFEMVTSSELSAGFYLGDGASNITIKNIRISGGESPAYNNYIPRKTYDATLSRFNFEDDVNNRNETYTAGVVLRSKNPIPDKYTYNVFSLDTLVNKNNLISGNDISGFGYGVVSLGIGALRAPNAPAYHTLYNTMNYIEDNEIHDIGKSGIFFGNEYHSNIEGNRIYDIKGISTTSNGGITLGAKAVNGKFGYHNIEIEINGNEISNIYSNQNSYGIDVVQYYQEFNDLSQDYIYPDMPEKIKITNNVIWGFEGEFGTSGADDNKFGIRIMSDDEVNSLYRTTDNLIAHNTLILEDDEVVNDGSVIAGVWLYHTENTKFFNNAVAVNDMNFNTDKSTVAAVYYEGLYPENDGIESNNNVFYKENANTAIYRFIELNKEHEVLEQGYQTEFENLDQWRQWTDQDWYSTMGNFITDHYLTGTVPPNIRINENPIPFNSILNNRAMELEDVTRDFLGIERAVANDKPDVGAFEFNGEEYNRDLELLSFVDPGTYKAAEPAPFSDLEYIMIPEPSPAAPFEITALIRNNSDITVSGETATLIVYRDTNSADTTTDEFVEEARMSVAVNDLKTDEIRELVFTDEEFSPKTYAEFRSPTQPYKDIPEEYQPQTANVSPVYKFVLELNNDENLSNNMIEKKSRFFIHKSDISLLISVDGIKDIQEGDGSTVNEIATNLNLDSLVNGFFKIGWYVDLEREDPRINIDIFDRSTWEPRSIDYPLYRTLFWVDGNDTRPAGEGASITNKLTRYERKNITDFLDAGIIGGKKNFVTASQEIVRNNTPDYEEFINYTLRADDYDPHNPLGEGVSYDSNYVLGKVVGRGERFRVLKTQYADDVEPMAGLFNIYSDDNTPGTSRLGFFYESRLGHNPEIEEILPESERVNAIATTTLAYNVFHTGVDWRHWADIEKVVRAILDFAENNNGNIIPVELTAFDAEAIGNRVDITWETASEHNSSHFDIQRANVDGKSVSTYKEIQEVEALGEGNVLNNYGPYVDRNVAGGQTYSYRLKMVDNDGEYEYSEPVTVTVDASAGIELTDVYPNPVQGTGMMTYTLQTDADVNISLYDINGNKVKELVDGITGAGSYELDINAKSLSSGDYIVIMRSGNSVEIKTVKVVK